MFFSSNQQLLQITLGTSFFLAEPGAHYFWKLVCWNDTQCRLAPGYLNPDSEKHFLKLEVKCKWSAISEKNNYMLCTLLYLFLSENARFQKSEDGYGPPAPIQSCFAGSKICYFWKGILSDLVIFPLKEWTQNVVWKNIVTQFYYWIEAFVIVFHETDKSQKKCCFWSFTLAVCHIPCCCFFTSILACHCYTDEDKD